MTLYPPPSYNINDKRQRTVTYAAAKRPIDKVIRNIEHVGVDATNVSTTIISTTLPGTVTGIRWNFVITQDGGTGVADCVWAIVLLKDGDTLDTLTFTDSDILYKPEQNCLVWGFSSIKNNLWATRVEGSTKTMRKLMIEDEIQFIAKGEVTNTSKIVGAIQLFIKT